MTDSTLKPAADAVKDAAGEAAQAVTTAADDAARAAKDAAADATKAAGDAAKDAEKAADKAVDAAQAAAKDVRGAAAGAAKDAGTTAKKAGAATEKKGAEAVDAVDGEKPKPQPPERSVAEIQAELAATRERLAGRIDDLAEYVKPANLVDRQVKKVTGIFVDEYGGIKPVPVLAAAAAVVGIVLVVGLGRRRHSS